MLKYKYQILKFLEIRENMTYKLCRFFVFVVVMLFVLISCNFESKKVKIVDEENLIINIWTVDIKSRFDKYMQYIIEKYEKLNQNIKINWCDFHKDEIVLKLYEAWQNGELPDIVSLDTDTLINKVNEDLFVNLYEFDEGISSVFFDGLLKSNEKNGKLLGIPWYTDIKVLFINKKIMNDSGIYEEQYPKTEEEFFNLLSVVKQNSGKFGSILEPENIKNLIFNGLNIFDETGNVNINTEEIINHFKKYQTQFQDSIVPREFLNFDDKIYLYANSEVAMLKANFSFISSIEKISREVYDDTINFPIPLGKNNIRHSETVNLSIVNNGKDLNKTLDLINFIVNERNQIELINHFNVLPTNKSLMDIENFLDNDSKIGQAKLIAFRSLENSQDFVCGIQNYNEISNIIEKYSRSIYLDGVNVEEFIGHAQNEINNFYVNY